MRTYEIGASGLVGLPDTCPPTADTVFAACDNPGGTGGTCTQGFGFTWVDTITNPACTVFNIVIYVSGVALNCNAADYLAPATLNGSPLSSAAALDTGAIRCNCAAAAQLGAIVTISGADQSAYVRGGTNTLTFTAPLAVGLSATITTNIIYASVLVNGG